ncbi:GDSL-type esterase/lipase family protein [Flavisolibacter ginsenosidimutans]|uniref:Sialate O-acetylesterase n=1 Tax=Flavisolibacter ginsenosidimutans TaxID=661481 RepID=A0A5B8UE17_9BACT|nr:GDSL-type esterase/lipase family protein [Flavisolibacter ginsenosidimutans]QEC54369.1 sialate O-acetylesterase [Flavisolibacter ginsenosidimutans]
MRKILRIIFFSACVFFITGNAFAQTAKWDSTYRPEIYPLQVAVFRAATHSKKDIVFLGNSITFWGNWTELLNSKHIKNRGVPGDITFGVLDRLDEVIGGQPNKVFILIGINDVARNIPDSVILQNYRRMIAAIKTGSPRTKIFFQSILPTNSAAGKLTSHYNKANHIKAINAGLKSLAEEEGVGFIDLYSAFADAEGNLPLNLTFDGVHLTKAGYDIWVDLLRKGNYLK